MGGWDAGGGWEGGGSGGVDLLLQERLSWS